MRSTPSGISSIRACPVVQSALAGSTLRSVKYCQPAAVCANTVTELLALVDL